MMLSDAAAPLVCERVSGVEWSGVAGRAGVSNTDARRAPLDAAPGRAIPSPSRQTLTPLEQSVVALAVMDARRAIHTPGRIGRMISWLWGGRPANQLADAQLEALRRFAVLMMRGKGRVDQVEVDAAERAGFSAQAQAEVRLLLRSVDGASWAAGRSGDVLRT